MKEICGLLLCVFGLVWTGCLGPLDTLGNETIVTEQEQLTKDQKPEDDLIEDKHPVYDPNLTVVEEFGPCQVTMNKSGTVTKLDVVPFEKDEEWMQSRLFPDRGTAIGALGEAGAELIPSIEVVNGVLKPFNDGLYAAIEVGLQDGVEGVLQSKRQLLADLLTGLAALRSESSPDQVAPIEEAIVFVAGGVLAGGGQVDIDAGLSSEARARLAAFDADGDKSKPVGFYTWNATLQAVFRQDRFLQNLEQLSSPEPFGAMVALAEVLRRDADLLQRYEQVLALYAGLTNPFASYTPVDVMPFVQGIEDLSAWADLKTGFEASHPELMTCSSARYALLPSSRSKDTEYFNGRWCNQSVPEGVSLIDEFIAAIRAGVVDLSPGDDSGWYDYQLWAMETLLLPERGIESDHLLLTAAYKQKLIDTFKSLITQSRETHVKQLQGASLAGSDSAPTPIYLYPKFPVEPFPTFFLRSARTYRFLDLYLQGVLGEDFLAGSPRLLEEGGAHPVMLADELRTQILRLYGLYFLTAQSVGLRPEDYLLEDELAEYSSSDCVAAAQTWLAGWREDEDVNRDPRVIVPVGHDAEAHQVVYWAILGIKPIRIRAEFVEGYEPEVVDAERCEVVGLELRDYTLLVERMEEIRISDRVEPLSRDEFRAICDGYDDVDSLVDALESL